MSKRTVNVGFNDNVVILTGPDLKKHIEGDTEGIVGVQVIENGTRVSWADFAGETATVLLDYDTCNRFLEALSDGFNDAQEGK